MAYEAPTYAEFIARFPIFDDTTKWPQAMVEAVIVEATNNIDTSWVEADYKPAIMYQTAHILSIENAAAGSDPVVGPQTYLASESFAGMSMSYAKVEGGTLSSSEAWGSTSYGRRYLDLLRKNKPAVVVA
jgi:hypothetical protein